MLAFWKIVFPARKPFSRRDSGVTVRQVTFLLRESLSCRAKGVSAGKALNRQENRCSDYWASSFLENRFTGSKAALPTYFWSAWEKGSSGSVWTV
jgi:hypothetical protein